MDLGRPSIDKHQMSTLSLAEPSTMAVRTLRQEDDKASMGYIARAYLKGKSIHQIGWVSVPLSIKTGIISSRSS